MRFLSESVAVLAASLVFTEDNPDEHKRLGHGPFSFYLCLLCVLRASVF